MTTVTIDEIRKNLNLYLKRVKAGETEGEFRVPDDFDDPLPDDTLRLFEG